MKKNYRKSRINVRANEKIVDKMKGIKCALNFHNHINLSDADFIELLINYFYDADISDLLLYMNDKDNWHKYSNNAIPF